MTRGDRLTLAANDLSGQGRGAENSGRAGLTVFLGSEFCCSLWGGRVQPVK